MKFKEFFKTSGFVHRHAPESNEIILLKIDELTKTTIEIFFQARLNLL